MMITLTLEEIYELQDVSGGVCGSCGEFSYGVEPDARHYTCEDCGAASVFGIDELLLMGKITII